MPTLTSHTRHDQPKGIQRAQLPNASDDMILAELAAGHPDAFDRFVSHHQPAVTRLAYRLLGWRGDVDDVVQEVFLVALRRIKSFRGDSSPSTWLMSITVNQCHNHRRRSMLRLRWLRDRFRPDVAGGDASDRVQRDETSQTVRDAVAALPQRDRDVIVLFYLEELSVKEIAELLGAKANAIEVRLHRARGRLKEKLAVLVQD